MIEGIVIYPLLVAAVLPYAMSLVAKSRGFGPAENHNPRQWQHKLQGWQQRAHAAHLNGFETLPIFAAALIIAGINNSDDTTVAMLGWGFVAARVLYNLCYVKDWAMPRSGCFFLSQATTVTLLLISF